MGVVRGWENDVHRPTMLHARTENPSRLISKPVPHPYLSWQRFKVPVPIQCNATSHLFILPKEFRHPAHSLRRPLPPGSLLDDYSMIRCRIPKLSVWFGKGRSLLLKVQSWPLTCCVVAILHGFRPAVFTKGGYDVHAHRHDVCAASAAGVCIRVLAKQAEKFQGLSTVLCFG